MKCYKHPDRDAIAVCVVCGRGVCEDCATRIGGKFYCKEDAEKIFERAPQYVARIEPTGRRSTSITVAAILFFIFGILEVVGSLPVMTAGGFVSYLPFFGFLGGLLALLGFIVMIVGILDIVAGYWLWGSLRKGGVLGIILAILGILTSIPFLLIPGWFALSVITLIINIVLIILIAVGWDTLH